MKILCIGRNYAAHAAELNNPVPKAPLIFMKPSTALLKDNKPFYHPEFSQDIHFEVELVLKIAQNGRHIEPQFASRYYKEVAIGIDFTARDIQQKCKEKGHPWEIAKAFDDSAPVSTFLPIEEVQLEDGSIDFSLRKNGEIVQQGNTKDMINPFDQLIVHSSKYFRLQMGDFIFTGTPAGVGPIQVGDVLEAYIGAHHLLTCEIR